MAKKAVSVTSVCFLMGSNQFSTVSDFPAWLQGFYVNMLHVLPSAPG